MAINWEDGDGTTEAERALRRCSSVDVHYTDQHLTRRGSSIDLIERCAAFARQAGDFEGVLDYADDDESGKFQTMLNLLVKEAMRIAAKEAA
jgi:hypothetical protein